MYVLCYKAGLCQALPCYSIGVASSPAQAAQPTHSHKLALSLFAIYLLILYTHVEFRGTGMQRMWWG